MKWKLNQNLLSYKDFWRLTEKKGSKSEKSMENKVMVPWCDVTAVTVAKDTLQTPLVTLWDAPTLWSPQKTTCGNSGLPLHKHAQKREHTHFWAISLVSNFLHLQKVNKLKGLDEPIGLYGGSVILWGPLYWHVFALLEGRVSVSVWVITFILQLKVPLPRGQSVHWMVWWELLWCKSCAMSFTVTRF